MPNNGKLKNLEVIKPDNYNPKDLVGLYSDLPLDFTPGEKFSYSNSGYNILGYLVEVITGNSYEEVLKARILIPLNMTNTGFDKHGALVPYTFPFLDPLLT